MLWWRVDHLSLAREHLARAVRQTSVGSQWESYWRAFELSLWHRYGKAEEGQMFRLIKAWSHDLAGADPQACERLARGEAIVSLRAVLPALDRMGGQTHSRAGASASSVLTRALRQNVPQMILDGALQVCRDIRNQIVHGVKVSSRVPDKELMLGSLPLIREAATLAAREDRRTEP